MAKNQGDWLRHLRSPHINMMKKYVWELIKERYDSHDEIIERICKDLNTTEDVEALGKLFADVYEAGFMKCVEEHRDKLEKLGLAATVVAESKPKTQPGKPIF